MIKGRARSQGFSLPTIFPERFHVLVFISIHTGVSKNMGKPPNHPFVHRGFPLFSPSILGGFHPPIFGSTPIFVRLQLSNSQSAGKHHILSDKGLYTHKDSYQWLDDHSGFLNRSLSKTHEFTVSAAEKNP